MTKQLTLSAGALALAALTGCAAPILQVPIAAPQASTGRVVVTDTRIDAPLIMVSVHDITAQRVEWQNEPKPTAAQALAGLVDEKTTARMFC